MTRKPETTGPDIARIAAIILGADIFTGGFCVFTGKRWHFIDVPDILAMAGSLVTQSADRETLRAGKLPKNHRVVRKGKPVTRNHKARA